MYCYIMTFNINSELDNIIVYSYSLLLLRKIIHLCPLPCDVPYSCEKTAHPYLTALQLDCVTYFGGWVSPRMWHESLLRCDICHIWEEILSTIVWFGPALAFLCSENTQISQWECSFRLNVIIQWDRGREVTAQQTWLMLMQILRYKSD